MNLVGCKWVYRSKYNSNGSIERYKARLVAQGFNQQPRIDYHETFSPVVRATTVCIVISLVVSYSWFIRQLDVKNIFLHGVFNEEVFMKQPPGFIHRDYPHRVCKLTKAIYDLKQALPACFHMFSTFLLAHGFVCSKYDSSMFILRINSSVFILLLYVDDIILTGSDKTLLDRFIRYISRQFAMKNLGEPIISLVSKMSVLIMVFTCLNRNIFLIYYLSSTCILVNLFVLLLFLVLLSLCGL